MVIQKVVTSTNQTWWTLSWITIAIANSTREWFTVILVVLSTKPIRHAVFTLRLVTISIISTLPCFKKNSYWQLTFTLAFSFQRLIVVNMMFNVALNFLPLSQRPHVLLQCFVMNPCQFSELQKFTHDAHSNSYFLLFLQLVDMSKIKIIWRIFETKSE